MIAFGRFTDAATITILGNTDRRVTIIVNGGPLVTIDPLWSLGPFVESATSSSFLGSATVSQNSDLELSSAGLLASGTLSYSQVDAVGQAGGYSEFALGFTVSDAGAGVPFTFQATVSPQGQAFAYLAGPATAYDSGVGLTFGRGFSGDGGGFASSGSNSGLLTGGEYYFRALTGQGGTAASFALTVGSVPEPSSVALILCGAFFCMRRRIQHGRNG